MGTLLGVHPIVPWLLLFCLKTPPIPTQNHFAPPWGVQRGIYFAVEQHDIFRRGEL